MEIVKTCGLKKYFGNGDYEVRALDGVDLSVNEGEFIAVVGSSGSGKTTLLNMLGGLDEPTEGKIYIRGQRFQGMNREAKTIFRRRNVGFVFQQFNLVPVLNVYENIVLPLRLDGQCPVSSACLRSEKSLNRCRQPYQADSSSGRRSQGRCVCGLPLSLPTNLPEIWIPGPVWRWQAF